MRLDSIEKNILWIVAVVCIIGECLITVFFGNYILASAMFVIDMILLNCIFVMEKRASSVMAVILFLSCLLCVWVQPRWYSGVIALPIVTACFYESKRLCRFMKILLLVETLAVCCVFDRRSPLYLLICAGILVAAFGIGEGLVFVLRQFSSTNAQLERALTASAVDAMEQRNLREEIAKSQSVNEHNARLQERERISRDIHNYVGHTLSAATVTLDAASMLVPNDQDKALEKIDVANSRVHEAISSVRSVVRTLDAQDDRIELSEYIKSLEHLVDAFKMDTDIKVYHNFSQIDSKDRIPMRVASFLSSSLSELLTNGVKHGQAGIFVITFVYDKKNIRVKVQDNGTGFGPISLEEKRMRIQNGFGLRKMQEQTEKWGGTCIIESTDGFAVSLSLPLEG